MGVGACMYQFVSVSEAGLHVGYEYMWGGNRPGTETMGSADLGSRDTVRHYAEEW